MSETALLDGKRVLIVDDEPDILQVLEELLFMCDVVRASTFEEARELLEKEEFDVAVLDIMGVNGYRLLEICNSKGTTAVMLTAHAFTPDNLIKSIKKGADSYIPKDEISNIASFINDIIEAKEKGEDPWAKWQEKLPSSYFERRFGAAWQDNDREFWESFKQGLRSKGKTDHRD